MGPAAHKRSEPSSTVVDCQEVSWSNGTINATEAAVIPSDLFNLYREGK